MGSGYTLDVLHYHEVSEDTATRDPQQGAHNVTEMVKTPCIVGMIGPAWSLGAVAELPVTARAGLVMISPANTMPGLTLRLYAEADGIDFDRLHPSGTKTTYFRDIANDAFQGLELAALTSRPPPDGLGARSAFVVSDNTPYGDELAGGFIQRYLALGGAVVGTETMPFGGAPRLAELAARIAAARPDVVVCGCESDAAVPGATLLKAQLVQVGYLGLFVGGDGISGDPTLDPTLSEQVGAAATNDVFAINPVPDPAQIASDVAARFVRAFHARYPGEVLDGYGANAYDAAMVLITAIKRLIQTGQPVTRQAVLDQVQTIQYSGVTGQISFDQNGDSSHGIFSVYTIQNGRWVWLKQSSV
jgi:branched-chain amino acid transport system substrate-binding protein